MGRSGHGEMVSSAVNVGTAISQRGVGGWEDLQRYIHFAIMLAHGQGSGFGTKVAYAVTQAKGCQTFVKTIWYVL